MSTPMTSDALRNATAGILAELPTWNIYRVLGFYAKSVELAGFESDNARAAVRQIEAMIDPTIKTSGPYADGDLHQLLGFFATERAQDPDNVAGTANAVAHEIGLRTGSAY